MNERETALKVLIADDSAVVRTRLAAMLTETEGIEIVGQAEDGIEAINAVKRLNPDAVILDIHMPRLNGIAALKMIKKENPSLRCIILTNYSNPVCRKRSLELGAEFFLDKSTDFEQIPAIIKQLAGGSTTEE